MSAPVQVGPSPQGGGPVPPLPDRDVELLERFARGESTQEIAAAWQIEMTSLWSVAERLRKRLGARTNEQAVFLACQFGILEPRRRHGDHAGFAAHRYRKEEPCEACWEGERAYRRAMRAARKAAGPLQPPGETGTS